ncbi:related to DNA repair protein rhp42 [Phialocephala subalpina]|uniref:Related to DNA repair protein rhp42 n=1 Tax=Phialocephala subalpina TaxID=576137 RepID=A0A1L7XIB6_9HELO|nr:related to DNA repair protein rhp42 [Phialocephala subalpina]
MPPFLPRKRLRSWTPEAEAGPSNPPPKPKSKGKASVTTTSRKPTLFDDLDAGTGTKRSAEHGKAALEKLTATEDESSLSSLSDEEFEDVPLTNRQKTSPADEDEDEDEDIEFEDVDTTGAIGEAKASANVPSGDLELTLTKDTRVSITNPFGTKKGPSKIERGIRIDTHRMHVQLLMWHNAIRNSWCCDRELQEMLVKALPLGAVKEVEKWRRNSGLDVKKIKEEETPKGKGKGKANAVKGRKADPRSQRDWGAPAERLEEGKVNMSAGDPLIGLLKYLKSYWDQRFRVTAPGLRKLGYMSLQRLDEEVKSFKEEYDPERHGERIRDIKEFRACAKAMEGSRDVGAQLFTALIRGLGLEARLVASLQPAGFGWSQNEEASKKNRRKLRRDKKSGSKDVNSSSDDEADSSEEEKPAPKAAKKGKASAKLKLKPAPKSTRRTSQGSGVKDAPIALSESEEEGDERCESDDDVIDITPVRQARKPSLPFDQDLKFPHYWTEVLSPVTNTYTPVDALVLKIVASGKETLEKFETRGTKSEKAKQVTAYIIGHSSDGTAKDVTTRYLKRHVWPGRTKGNRYPVEKIAIRNRYGKVKRYEEYDWFKTVMSGYLRGTKSCPRTEIDDHEEATDLKPVKPEKKEVEEGKETLQYYKSSPDFVLERHLKREEALLPTATHVKMFPVKGKGEATTEEKVYLRKDVVSCKSQETWHKEGRAPKVGEDPLKRVPYRAATTNRRRELAEAENASGEKVLQGLYSWDQTDWIIPPPIENGIIPKNSFGNIDLYVDSMLPEGAVHLPMRGTVKICKRLNIDYAEAVTGFEFGHRMAVPVISGVVVAEEHYDSVMDEWHKDEAERVRKEDEKRRKAALGMWRKMLMGLRIIERVKGEYGDVAGDADILNPFANTKKRKEDADAEAQRRIMDQRDEEMAGGFLPEGFDVEESEERRASFFPVAQEGDDDDEHGGGFVVEGHDEPSKPGQAYATPQSLEPATKNGTARVSEEDVEMQDAESEVEAPAPKKRGRPSGSTAAKSKAKTPAKRGPKPKTPTSKKAGKRKSTVQDSEQEDDDDESPLSDLESDLDSDIEEPPKQAVKKPAGRRKTLPAKTTAVESPRKTPRRTAARKSETALRSHYFEHGDDDMDEDDE